MLKSISSETLIIAEKTHDFSKAEILVKRMHEANQLNQLVLVEFAKTNRYAETVAALAHVMCRSDRHDRAHVQ